MGKKEKAFDLFLQHRKPNDPEVKALGLKEETRNAYYWDFLGQAYERVCNDHAAPVEYVLPALMHLVESNRHNHTLAVFGAQVVEKHRSGGHSASQKYLDESAGTPELTRAIAALQALGQL